MKILWSGPNFRGFSTMLFTYTTTCHSFIWCITFIQNLSWHTVWLNVRNVETPLLKLKIFSQNFAKTYIFNRGVNGGYWRPWQDKIIFLVTLYFRAVTGYLKLGGQVKRRGAALYFDKNWVGNCPPATYAPVIWFSFLQIFQPVQCNNSRALQR